MRLHAKFSILIVGLIAAYTALSSAAAKSNNNCEFNDAEIASSAENATQALLESLPKGSSVKICQYGRNKVEVSILGPIDNRDSVSFYRKSIFEIPAERLSKTKGADGLWPDGQIYHVTLMALDPNSELTHQSEDIVSTRSISVGTFKSMYKLWADVVEDSEKLRDNFEISKLDNENRSQYEKLIHSLKNSTRARIEYLEFKELRLVDGDGIDLEFFPRLVVSIATKTQWWEIDYDILDSEQYTLLNVELRMEAVGAN